LLVDAVGVDELPEQARLAHAGFADERDDLTAAASRLLECAADRVQLAFAPDEAGEPACGRRLDA
jgi:hypothetical protein